MEWEIIQVLKQAAGTRFSDREIGKIVDRKEYRERPHWARPLLDKLAVEQILWKEDALYFFPTDEQRAEKRKKSSRDDAKVTSTYQVPKELQAA